MTYIEERNLLEREDESILLEEQAIQERMQSESRERIQELAEARRLARLAAADDDDDFDDDDYDVEVQYER